jgi:Concanavalin A-like lectin/glucanases superfamily/Bacterial Ig domain
MAIRILVGGGRFDKALPERGAPLCVHGSDRRHPSGRLFDQFWKDPSGLSREILPKVRLARSLLRSARSRHLPEALMKYFGILLVSAMVLTFGSPADAQVLTFNELAPPDNPILGSIECVANGSGFRFFSDHFHLIGIGNTAVFEGFTSNDTAHIGYESGRGFPVTMARVGAGTFSLFSLDAAEFYAQPVPDRPDAERLTITGFQAGGGTVTHTLTLDGVRDGPAGVVDFQHFTLPGTFVNLTSVVFTGLRGVDEAGGVSVDNLEYTLSVPGTIAPCVLVPLPSDTPTVAITSPAAGNVMGTVAIQATASDNVGVEGVQFKIDGANLGAEDVTAPYAASWDTTLVPDGSHTITAEARDAAGNIGTASVVVNVRNTPVNTNTPHYVEFDGANDYAEVGDSPLLSFGSGATDTPLTFEVWLRPDTLAGKHQFVSKWGETTNQEYRLYAAANAIRLDLRDQSAQATVSAYTTSSQAGLVGAWHHLAVTYDGRGGSTAAAGITIYIDGVAVPLTRINSAAYAAMENLGATLQIGREGPAWKQYDGGLDDLRLWSIARTPADIQAFMAMELTGLEPGLRGYWRFNEGTGNAVEDDSPASQAAALFNGTAWVAGGPLSGPDDTPPEITGITMTGLTATGITVRFNTSETATGWVSYTAGAACRCTS